MPSGEPDTEPALPQAAEAASPDSPAPARGPGRRRGVRVPLGRRGWAIAVSAGVVVALVAGLVVWSPWQPSPPSAVRVTGSTATTAEISWAASGGIASPGRYLVLRDGQQVGSVPASATSWTDHGLSPGTTYDYTVAAAGWGQSGPSAAAIVTTPAPSPAGLAVTRITHSTATLHWSRPRNAPVPDLYQIYNGFDLLDTIEGTVTSYTNANQQPGTVYQYSVVAQWGDHKSAPSAPALGEQLALPVSGSVPVSVVTTSTPGGGASLSVGYHWDDAWDFYGSCPGDICKISAYVGIRWTQRYQSYQYPITLHGAGRTYSGTAQVNATHCQSVQVTDTLTVTITSTGAVVNGAWQAWTGTMVVDSPLVASGSTYCPAQSWRFAITSKNAAGPWR
jgi:hypothetical protein